MLARYQKSFLELLAEETYPGDIVPMGELIIASNTLIGAPLVTPPDNFWLNEFERQSVPGVLAKATGICIKQAVARWNVGRLFSFDVFPAHRPDPVFVFTKFMDMKDYYTEWAFLATRALPSQIAQHLDLYDQACSKAVLSARGLTRKEVHFFLFEALNARNVFMERMP